MEAKVILVTGGAGYIGSHTCKLLASKAIIPLTVDNLSTGHADNVRYGPLEVADIRDTDRLVEIIRQYGVTRIMHFAASAYVGESVANPQKYYENNVCGMISLLSACRIAGVSKLVLSSSCATYGIPAKLPIEEASAQNPINPYGLSKLICEQMLKDYDRAYGFDHVILRYFNAAGADLDGELEERHDPETHLIPLAMLAASGRGKPLTILGNDYSTSDGTCVRDYIHVQDLAVAHVLALQKLDQNDLHVEVNLGTGAGYSILEILREIERFSGLPVPFEFGARRIGDPPVLIAAPDRARDILGFVPAYSDLSTIIASAAPAFGLTSATPKGGQPCAMKRSN